jgi:RNA-directed DNA polymerase
MIVDLIARDLGIPANYIGGLVRSASHRYFSFTIPKKSVGDRVIHHPSRELKLIQRWLIKNVFGRLPVHDAAFGYRKGLNIAQHAAIHTRHNFLLKLDFTDFFPSILGTDVVNILRRNARSLSDIIASEADYEAIRLVVCRRGSLTIGAPSSPLVSNVVMFEFDRDWTAWSQAKGIVYSRYADDLCFSTDQRDLLADLLNQLRADIAKRDSPRLQLNDVKTVFTSRKRRRLVTGLILTPTKEISVGRARKRKVKSLVFQFSKGRLSEPEKVKLRGIVTYIRSVEPTFINALKKKYEPEVLATIGV